MEVMFGRREVGSNSKLFASVDRLCESAETVLTATKRSVSFGVMQIAV